MNKSHLSQANNPHPVVTPHDIGGFVKVAGVGTGTLRYVGPIQGKDGLFCGIELDHAIGKHNGTFQGISYFTCPPERGIFAPLYKVELDEPDDVPMMSASELKLGHERLSRSALPALQLKNVARPEPDPMNTSVYSNVMDSSLFSQTSWGDITDMCASNTTYVIPPGKGIFDEDEDLMNVEAPSNVVNIDREAVKREEERLLGASYVVQHSRIPREKLPVVPDNEDDPDLITPMVETRPLTSGSQESWNVSTESEGLIASSTQSNAENESHDPETSRRPSESSEETKTPASTSIEKTTSSGKKMTDSQEKTVEKKAPKKEEPAAPKFPVKPKPLTKHQIMMQQLKASIEADKNKPKKEAKARVPLIPPPPPPKQKENEGEKMVNETPKRALKQPLKAVNETPKAPPVERPKKERKPLYVAPPPKEREEKKPPTKTPIASAPRPATASKAVSKESVNAEKKDIKPKSASQFPTSSFAGGPKSKLGLAKTSKPKKSIEESEKLARLLRAGTVSVALALTVQTIAGHKRVLEGRLESVERRLKEEKDKSENLRARLGQVEQNHKEDVERMKNTSEQLTKSHAETLERLKKSHELTDKARDFEKTLEDEKHKHEMELEAMDRRHQKVIGSLDEKISESEKSCEKLKADKKSLQEALANDSDQRNQMLTKEITSLQTALEFKSNEMKELRQLYQVVALRVEEIPLKDLEITKLKHKVVELKQALDQKITYERLLVHQNEELKRLQLLCEEEKDTMKRSIDVMMYHYENGEDPMTSSRHSSTPAAKVTFRSRSSNSAHRPNSGIPPEARLSMSSCAGDMDRSLERDSLTRSAISMYASQCKLPENHAEDVIYAPDEIITGGVTSRRLSEEDPLLHTNGNHTDPQTDSGICL